VGRGIHFFFALFAVFAMIGPKLAAAYRSSSSAADVIATTPVSSVGSASG